MTFDPTAAPFSGEMPDAPPPTEAADPFLFGDPAGEEVASRPAGARAPARRGGPERAPMGGFDLLADVEIEITVEFGRRRLPLGEVANLEVGSVIELDALAGEPLAIYANGRRIATGEAVVVDGQFAVRIASLSR